MSPLTYGFEEGHPVSIRQWPRRTEPLSLERRDRPASGLVVRVERRRRRRLDQRAQAGARKLYRIITDKRSPDHTGSIGSMENAEATLADAAPHDTLTPDDLSAEWQMPSAP